MCGIAGVVHSDTSRDVSPAVLRAMCDAIAHRGPDDFGSRVDGPVGIGMRRLSIIDLSTGQQPLSNEDGTVWIVFNGEIYNYRQLRQGLEARGHRLRTTSDTEVIVHLYEDHGAECVTLLRGMFAFAIWDGRTRTLLLARDRLGIKPLYFAHTPDGLLFASELKALLAHPLAPRAVDPEAVAEYFIHLCVPGDLSIFHGIRKLLPAHVLVYRDNRATTRRYWEVRPHADRARSEQEWTEQLREQLRVAVDLHMVADVPVGAFLSGGLDSGAVVALMARQSPEPIRTFTVGFTTAVGRFDERDAARAVADRYRTAHRECMLETDAAELLPRIVRAFDEPFADSSAIPNWLICQETARHVKVALSGLGGDELFGGYERYAGLQAGEWYRHVPRPLRRLLAGAVRALPAGNGSSYVSDRLKRFVAAAELSTVESYRSMIAAFGDPWEVLQPDLRAGTVGWRPRFEQVVTDLGLRHPVDLAQYTDLLLYLPDDILTLTDRVSMAHSLEVRVPYVDHTLLEFVAAMPPALRVRGFRKKYLFRRTVAPWLPPENLARPKQGFSIPLASWLKGPLRPMLTDLLESQALRESPWLSAPAVRSLVEEHLRGTQNHEVRLWAILCFSEWERQYIRG